MNEHNATKKKQMLDCTSGQNTSIKIPSSGESNVDRLHEINFGSAQWTQRQGTCVRTNTALASANVTTWQEDDVGL